MRSYVSLNRGESFRKLKKSITSYFLFAVKKGGHEKRQII